MKELYEMAQLEMCIKGNCDRCVHETEGGCRDLQDLYQRDISAALLELESYRQVKNGSFMNHPE